MKTRQSCRWIAAASSRRDGTMESSWFAASRQLDAGEEGCTLVEPPTIVRAQPPRALASW